MAEPYRIQWQQVVSAALEGATVVTANTRAARSLLAECNRRRRGVRTWRTPAVLPLSAWLSELWRAAQAGGHVDATLLGAAQQESLWRQIIESGTVPVAMNAPALAGLATEAWQIVHAYELPLRSSQFTATAETKAFRVWAASYQDASAARGWTDPARQIDLLLPAIPCLRRWLPALKAEPSGPAGQQMLWVGFDRLTPQQHRLLEALETAGVQTRIVGAQAETRSRSVLASDRRGSSQLDFWGGRQSSVRLADRADELETAAAWARAHLEANPTAQIGVVVSGIGSLRKQIERTFSSVLHPERYFSLAAQASAFEISLGQPLADYPIIGSLLTFLRLAGDGSVTQAEFSAWLRSPYFGTVGEQLLARSRLDRALAEKLPPRVTASSVLSALGTRSLAGHSAAATRVTAQLRALRTLGGNAARRPAEWVDEICRALVVAGWPGEDSGITLDSPEYQAREAWESVLTEVGGLELVSSRMSWPAALEAILRAASTRLFQPRNLGAPIQVMGELEAAGCAFDTLWIAGWSDSEWPRRHALNPLLPPALARRHNVPHSSSEIDLSFARATTARLLESAPEVVVSWPACDQERELRPSALIRHLPQVQREHLPAPDLPPATTPTNFDSLGSLLELFPAAALEQVADEHGPAAVVSELRWRGTRILERQSNCPFRAFAEFRLGAAEPRATAEGLAPTDRGALVEAALEFAWDDLRDSFTLESCGEERLRAVIDAAIEKAFARLERRNGSPANGSASPASADCWQARYLALERERLRALLGEWFDFERRRENFIVLEHQRTVEPTFAGLPIEARIDRLDRLPDGKLVIIDYKTGRQSPKTADWETPRPRAPQLPCYAAALAQGSPPAEIAAVAFGMVKRGGCEMVGAAERPEILGRQSLRGPELRASLESWAVELKRLAGDFMAGEAEVAPKHPPGTSRCTCDTTYCSLAAVCRMAEIDFTDSGEDGDGAE